MEWEGKQSVDATGPWMGSSLLMRMKYSAAYH